MSNESIGRGDDELERRIDALESEDWLGALKELKPSQSVDLYAIGFEAGKQAALVSHPKARPQDKPWFHVPTALSASVVSIAATLLITFALRESADERLVSPGTSEVAVKVNQPQIETETSPPPSVEKETQPSVQEPAASFNDALAELPSRWRERLQVSEIQINELQAANGEDSKRVVDVEPSRLRYAFQRKQLIENLRETIQ